jgi:Zn-dependent protease
MDEGLRFQLFGFPVLVQPGFFFIASIVLVFGLQAQSPLWMIASSILVIFVSILVHELGHAVVSRAFGLQVHGIFMHGFGGHVTHAPGTTRQRLMISLAGPAAGFLLAGVCLGVFLISRNPLTSEIMSYGLFINLVWSAFNLLPIFPMDGGHAMLSGLSLITSARRAQLLTFGVGVPLAAGLAIVGWQLGFIFVTLFCAMFAFQNVQLLRRVVGVRRAAEG